MGGSDSKPVLSAQPALTPRANTSDNVSDPLADKADRKSSSSASDASVDEILKRTTPDRSPPPEPWNDLVNVTELVGYNDGNRKIGSGFFSVVFRVTCPKDGSNWALKRFVQAAAADAEDQKLSQSSEKSASVRLAASKQQQIAYFERHRLVSTKSPNAGLLLAVKELKDETANAPALLFPLCVGSLHALMRNRLKTRPIPTFFKAPVITSGARF